MLPLQSYCIYIAQNDNIEGSCKALHDFYGLACG